MSTTGRQKRKADSNSIDLDRGPNKKHLNGPWFSPAGPVPNEGRQLRRAGPYLIGNPMLNCNSYR